MWNRLVPWEAEKRVVGQKWRRLLCPKWIISASSTIPVPFQKIRKHANKVTRETKLEYVYYENQNVSAVVIIIIDILIINVNHCYCHHYCHHHQVWRHHLAASVGGNEEYWPLCSIRIFPDAFHPVIIIIILSYIIIDVITIIIISLTSFFVEVFVSQLVADQIKNLLNLFCQCMMRSVFVQDLVRI